MAVLKGSGLARRRRGTGEAPADGARGGAGAGKEGIGAAGASPDSLGFGLVLGRGAG